MKIKPSLEKIKELFDDLNLEDADIDRISNAVQRDPNYDEKSITLDKIKSAIRKCWSDDIPLA